MAKTNTTTRRGFTFIEVLVALAVASIGLLGLLRLHLVSMATADAADAQTAAVFLAQEKLAEVSAADDPTQATGSGVLERNGLKLTWTTQVSDADAAATAGLDLRGLRQVRSTVTWQQGRDLKNVQMATLVADTRINEKKTK